MLQYHKLWLVKRRSKKLLYQVYEGIRSLPHCHLATTVQKSTKSGIGDNGCGGNGNGNGNREGNENCNSNDNDVDADNGTSTIATMMMPGRQPYSSALLQSSCLT
jgi:hypothetical protein